MLLNIRVILILSLAAVLVPNAQAAIGFAPATLPQGTHSIESLIELPDDIQNLDCKVTCELHVMTTGVALWTQCYGTGQPVPNAIRDAVRDAHHEARFIPALIGGERTPVWMHTTTSINIVDSKRTIVVVPNDNADERRKAGYSSPQVYGPMLTRNFLWRANDRRIRRPQVNPLYLTITVYVSAMGTPWAYAIKEELKLQDWRRKDMDYYVQHYKFIPAVEDGVPVESIYKEVVDSRRRR